MKLKLLIVILLSSLITLVGTAGNPLKHIETSCCTEQEKARYKEHFYVKGNLLVPVYNLLEDHDWHDNHNHTPFGSVAVGYTTNKIDHALTFSLELEGFYKKQQLNFDPEDYIPFKTDVEAYGVFTNLIVKHKNFNISNIKPFIGAGIGYGRTKASDVMSGNANRTTLCLGQSQDNFIYQFILGASYDINSAFTFHTDVRWVHFSKILERINNDQSYAHDIQSKFSNLTLGIGITYKL